MFVSTCFILMMTVWFPDYLDWKQQHDQKSLSSYLLAATLRCSQAQQLFDLVLVRCRAQRPIREASIDRAALVRSANTQLAGVIVDRVVRILEQVAGQHCDYVAAGSNHSSA